MQSEFKQNNYNQWAMNTTRLRSEMLMEITRLKIETRERVFGEFGERSTN